MVHRVGRHSQRNTSSGPAVGDSSLVPVLGNGNLQWISMIRCDKSFVQFHHLCGKYFGIRIDVGAFGTDTN